MVKSASSRTGFYSSSPTRPIARLALAALLALPLAAAGLPAVAQQATPPSNATVTAPQAAPLTKDQRKAQRKTQKQQEKAAKENAKASKDKAKALEQQNKATDNAEKAARPQ